MMHRNGDARGEPDIPAEAATPGNAFQENATRIYAFIYAKVGNRAAAEDLTSQVFLKAVRWLAADRSADSIRSWLYATARTVIADYWREQSTRVQVPLEDFEDVLFQGSDGPAESRRTREWAHRVLAALPERESAVLRLRFLKGYSAAEVGHALGLTAGNVRVIQVRALQRAASMGLGPAGDDGADRDRGESDE
ncbi:MAG: RNA polymerase sigma factor [Chloroflexota bacterium]